MRKINFYILIILMSVLTFSSCKEEDLASFEETSVEFNPDVTYGSIEDIDGNVYKTVTICGQTWMAENLRTTHYQNGEPIKNIIDNSKWEDLSTAAYSWYENDSTNKYIYGALYNWYAVNDSRKIAPEGWHIATDEEWATLMSCLGGNEYAGAKMKEIGIKHWNSTSEEVTNESGFTALPSGSRFPKIGYFGGLGESCSFWASTEKNDSIAYSRGIGSENLYCGRGAYLKGYGFSVRCVKDNN